MPTPRHVLIVGGTADDRRRHADAATAELGPGSIVALDAATLPFLRPKPTLLPASVPRVLRIDAIELAFPNEQSAGTRLILTQSTYTVQTWLDLIDAGDVIVATADRAALERGAAEAFSRRGPWAAFRIVNVDLEAFADPTDVIPLAPGAHPRRELTPMPPLGFAWPRVGMAAGAPSPLHLLAAAFCQASADERMRLCREAVGIAPDSPEAALALASALREIQDLGEAHQALDRSIALAPDWAAAHYEVGKFWLGCEDLPRARDGFRRASELMPSFSAACSNLGATLGELGEPDAALAAFEQALRSDANNPTLLNNVGVVNRELGQLNASEAALRQVTSLSPAFVFGHYNLGHTLFLSGRFQEALEAYLEGQRRDPERNLRQSCRLAMVRFAAGDVEGADRDLWRAADAAPPEEREDLLLEAYEIAGAVAGGPPAPGPRQAFLDRLAAAILT